MLKKDGQNLAPYWSLVRKGSSIFVEKCTSSWYYYSCMYYSSGRKCDGEGETYRYWVVACFLMLQNRINLTVKGRIGVAVARSWYLTPSMHRMRCIVLVSWLCGFCKNEGSLFWRGGGPTWSIKKSRVQSWSREDSRFENTENGNMVKQQTNTGRIQLWQLSTAIISQHRTNPLDTLPFTRR